MTDMIDVKDELTKLMGSFEGANTEWKNKKKEVDDTYRKMSDIVLSISKLLGTQKKFRYKGMELTIVERPFKDGSGSSWFFRGLPKGKGEDMIEIG